MTTPMSSRFGIIFWWAVVVDTKKHERSGLVTCSLFVAHFQYRSSAAKSQSVINQFYVPACLLWFLPMR